MADPTVEDLYDYAVKQGWDSDPQVANLLNMATSNGWVNRISPQRMGEITGTGVGTFGTAAPITPPLVSLGNRRQAAPPAPSPSSFVKPPARPALKPKPVKASKSRRTPAPTGAAVSGSAFTLPNPIPVSQADLDLQPVDTGAPVWNQDDMDKYIHKYIGSGDKRSNAVYDAYSKMLFTPEGRWSEIIGHFSPLGQQALTEYVKAMGPALRASRAEQMKKAGEEAEGVLPFAGMGGAEMGAQFPAAGIGKDLLSSDANRLVTSAYSGRPFQESFPAPSIVTPDRAVSAAASDTFSGGLHAGVLGLTSPESIAMLATGGIPGIGAVGHAANVPFAIQGLMGAGAEALEGKRGGALASAAIAAGLAAVPHIASEGVRISRGVAGNRAAAAARGNAPALNPASVDEYLNSNVRLPAAKPIVPPPEDIATPAPVGATARGPIITDPSRSNFTPSEIPSSPPLDLTKEGPQQTASGTTTITLDPKTLAKIKAKQAEEATDLKPVDLGPPPAKPIRTTTTIKQTKPAQPSKTSEPVITLETIQAYLAGQDKPVYTANAGASKASGGATFERKLNDGREARITVGKSGSAVLFVDGRRVTGSFTDVDAAVAHANGIETGEVKAIASDPAPVGATAEAENLQGSPPESAKRTSMNLQAFNGHGYKVTQRVNAGGQKVFTANGNSSNWKILELPGSKYALIDSEGNAKDTGTFEEMLGSAHGRDTTPYKYEAVPTAPTSPTVPTSPGLPAVPTAPTVPTETAKPAKDFFDAYALAAVKDYNGKATPEEQALAARLGKKYPGIDMAAEKTISDIESRVGAVKTFHAKEIAEAVRKAASKGVPPAEPSKETPAETAAKQRIVARDNNAQSSDTTLGMNADPQQLARSAANLKDYAIIGYEKLKSLPENFRTAGQRFTAWANEMIRSVGDSVRPHLTKVWEDIQDLYISREKSRKGNATAPTGAPAKMPPANRRVGGEVIPRDFVEPPGRQTLIGRVRDSVTGGRYREATRITGNQELSNALHERAAVREHALYEGEVNANDVLRDLNPSEIEDFNRLSRSEHGNYYEKMYTKDLPARIKVLDQDLRDAKAAADAAEAAGATPEDVRRLRGQSSQMYKDVKEARESLKKGYNKKFFEVMHPDEEARILSNPKIAKGIEKQRAISDDLLQRIRYTSGGGLTKKVTKNDFFVPTHAIDANPDGSFGAPVGAEAQVNSGRGTIQGSLRQSRAGASRYARGTGANYLTDLKSILQTSYGKIGADMAKKNIYRTLLSLHDAQGNALAKTIKQGASIPETITYNGTEHKAAEYKFDFVDAKGDTKQVRVAIPEGLVSDLDDALVPNRVEPSAVQKFARRVAGISTESAIASLDDLKGHINRLISITSAVPPVLKSDKVRIAQAVVPLYAKINTLVDAVNLDFDNPDVQARLNRIIKVNAGSTRPFQKDLNEGVISKVPVIGGLVRVGNEGFAPTGAIGKTKLGKAWKGSHEILFGMPKGGGVKKLDSWTGLDLRLRVLMEGYREAQEGNQDPQRIRDFSYQWGQYVRKADKVIEAGKTVNPFSATSLPMRVTELRQAAGDSGLKAGSIKEAALLRVETLARKYNGVAMFALANYLMSGHWPWQNDKGKEFALEYRTDKGLQYFDFGEMYPDIKRSLNTLGVPRLMSDLSNREYDNEIAANMGTGAANNLLSAVTSPAANTASVALTGRAPYLIRDSRGVLTGLPVIPHGRNEYPVPGDSLAAIGTNNVIGAAALSNPTSAAVYKYLMKRSGNEVDQRDYQRPRHNTGREHDSGR